MKAHAALPIRILTHNIRYATTSPFKGEKPWSERKHLIINELKHNTLYNEEAFICLQEVLQEQLLDILAGLNGSGSCTTLPSSGPDAQGREEALEILEREGKSPDEEWTYIGVGRDDGHRAGEYSPILFRPRIWRLSSWKSIWLSPTPDRPSKGWDAGSIRIVTVGSFTHRSSAKSVVGLCTHFDEQGAVSRRESARIIQHIIAEPATYSASASPDTPVWLAGDLNSEPSEEAYQILNAHDSLVRDSRDLAEWTHGNAITCTGFQEEMRQVIDFVFVSKKGWDVKGHGVLGNVWDEGVYCSDHRAVVVDAVLE